MFPLERKKNKSAFCYLLLSANHTSFTRARIKNQGVQLSAEAIIEAPQNATLRKIQLPKETVYCKSLTEGDFETIALAVGLEKLPSLAIEQQIKTAFCLNSMS